MRCLVLIILFSLALVSKAQDTCSCVEYFRERSVAVYEDFKGNTKDALLRFENAETKFPHCTNAGPDLTFIKMYLSVNDTISAFNMMIKEVKHGYELEKMKGHKIAPSSFGTYYDQLISMEDSLHHIFQSNLDIDKLLFLHELYSIDQGILKVQDVEDSLKREIRKKIERQNIQKVVNYIKNNNTTFTYSDLGYLNKFGILLIHHWVEDENDSLNLNFLIEQYTEDIKKGKRLPNGIVHLFDKLVFVAAGQLQTFGFWYDRERKIFPLKDPEQVDSIRLSYGMNTLREYAEMKNLILPDNYEE